MSNTKAIIYGLIFVNGPVYILLLGTSYFMSIDDQDKFTFFFTRGIFGFILAWLWWSLMVPQWRLWAFKRVDDIQGLKAQAVKVGLTWPDGNIFTRTEIKSSAHTAKERALEEGSA